MSFAQGQGDRGIDGSIASLNNDKSDGQIKAVPKLEQLDENESGTATPAAKRVKLHDGQEIPERVGITPEPSKQQPCCGASPCTAQLAKMKELLQREAGYNTDHEDVVRKRQDYIDWDTYFMATAVLSSLRSKDPHHGSGCCIVDKRKRIIGIGYNGFPMGASDDVLPWKKPSESVRFLHTYEPYVVHAAINAILCSGDVQGATLFVTEFPTAESAKAIIQAGISEVVYNNDCMNDTQDFDSHKASRIMFKMAGIKMRKFVASRSNIQLVRTGARVDAPLSSNDKPPKDALKSELESHRALLKREAGLEEIGSLKRLDYLSWDDYFLWMAFLTAQRSKDPNTQVGACLVLNKRIVGLGYNGFPLGCSDDLLPWSRQGESSLHTKYPYVCHAEVNAVMNRIFPNIRGASLYVALFPCNECAKFIIQAGIREVVFLDDKYHDTDICRASRILFGMAGVTLRQHTPADISLKLRLEQTTKNTFGN